MEYFYIKKTDGTMNWFLEVSDQRSILSQEIGKMCYTLNLTLGLRFLLLFTCIFHCVIFKLCFYRALVFPI